MEQVVSAEIGAMSLALLRVEDEADKWSDRAYLERNAIALLSTSGSSKDWLGRYYAEQPRIRDSGLWNVMHVGDRCHPAFLDVLSCYIQITLCKKEHPKERLVPNG
jgi:hypothetical protein